MATAKVLFSYSHEELNNQLQEWLAEGGVTILGVSMDSNRNGHCLAVLYELGGSAQYEGDVLFAWAHTDVEAQANDVLQAARPADGAQFIAVGSNEHGHCLCIIRQVA